ncbi:nucleopolyhedrovirus P10 family protein [Streptomyces radicis]|uniref:Nucleopolyhedrovirus P10 family protein n=1 Tax=Streptomyces radicis TaxID=1750517 RepID=A0A3A9WD18_9ACTN|nr:nucleopolyhedrovirus P10 family protein [Streptomyces radicis]RKN03907.1 nucleopolyhedrovirus P10 family protein [Streptomyces radicis]RKN14153.1 nucleopolyhedrovirus P10 family protein [Streptomyces radicis]
MGADPLSAAVRRQLSLGRLVPLGPPEGGVGAWLAERAARPVLRSAAEDVPGVAVERIDITPAADGGAWPGEGPPGEAPPGELAVPPPPSGLPPGPLRIGAGIATGLDRPLPEYADEVRAALAWAADERLGLAVAFVDCEVTGLLGDGERPPPAGGVAEAGEAAGDADEPVPALGAGPAADVAVAILSVPGVRALSAALGGPASALTVDEDLIRCQLVVAPDRRARDVALAAGRAAAEAAPGAPRVSVLVTRTGARRPG